MPSNRYANITHAQHTIWNQTETNRMLKYLRGHRTSILIWIIIEFYWLRSIIGIYTECRFIKSFSYRRSLKCFRLGLRHWPFKSIHIQTNCMPCWIIEITTWINKSYSNRLVCLCCYVQCVNNEQYTGPSTINTWCLQCILRTYKYRIFIALLSANCVI